MEETCKNVSIYSSALQISPWRVVRSHGLCTCTSKAPVSSPQEMYNLSNHHASLSSNDPSYSGAASGFYCAREGCVAWTGGLQNALIMWLLTCNSCTHWSAFKKDFNLSSSLHIDSSTQPFHKVPYTYMRRSYAMWQLVCMPRLIEVSCAAVERGGAPRRITSCFQHLLHPSR